MSTSYDEMWEKLNLDLDAHAGLLQVLGKFYGDIYIPTTTLNWIACAFFCVRGTMHGFASGYPRPIAALLPGRSFSREEWLVSAV
jgi:hypothetical protein